MTICGSHECLDASTHVSTFSFENMDSIAGCLMLSSICSQQQINSQLCPFWFKAAERRARGPLTRVLSLDGDSAHGGGRADGGFRANGLGARVLHYKGGRRQARAETETE